MNTAEKKFLTEEEYLEFERNSEIKHEYYAGEIFAMSGGTMNHSRIGSNLIHLLMGRLAGRDCDVLTSDMMVRIEQADSYVYPDVTVICGKPDMYKDNPRILLNPTVIFEVLSETTEGFDRGGKFRKYQTIESLKEYVLIDQWTPHIDILRPSVNGKWELESFSGLENDARLESMGIEASLSAIYHRVEF